MGSKTPLSINLEQAPGFRLGKVEGLIFCNEISLICQGKRCPLFRIPLPPISWTNGNKTWLL